MLIGSMMTTSAVTCRADDTLERAAQLMWERDIGFLPVVDGSGCLIGVITDRDAFMAAYVNGCAMKSQLVAKAMSRDVVCCTILDEVTDIEHRMARAQVRRLPVVDAHRRVVGIVTLSDFARRSQIGHEFSSRGPTWTLAAITHPRH